MSRLFDRLFGPANDDEPEEGRPRFLDLDRDDLWGQNAPDRERRPAYEPPDTDNLTFVQPRIPAPDPEPPVPPPGRATRRLPDISLPALTDPHRAAWDARYEARTWPKDGEGLPTADTLRDERDADRRDAYIERLSRTGEYSPEELEERGDRYLGLERQQREARATYDPPPIVERPPDPHVSDLDVPEPPGHHDIFTGAFLPDTPDTVLPELPDVPEVAPDWRIAAVTGTEQGATTGEVAIAYEPREEDGESDKRDIASLLWG